jgi:hypothetical protein
MSKDAEIHNCDCLEWTKQQPDDSVDLVFGSPPYEAARTYGIGFKLKGQDWVDWAVERFVDQVRICRGVVCWVIEGQTNDFRWSATPALFMADLHRAGVHLRKPPLYVRHGIPGSGGPDWLKNRYEFIVSGTSGGKLPWSDNTACGAPPKREIGGPMSNRKQNGERFNVQTRRAPSGARAIPNERDRARPLPDKANPGNLIDCGADTHFGLGNETDAPFPERLVEPFVLSFCPPGGIVYDPFAGSGTAAIVALENGRRFVGTDIRECQVKLTGRRISEVQKQMF